MGVNKKEQTEYYNTFFKSYSRNNGRVNNLIKYFDQWIKVDQKALEIGCGIGLTSALLLSKGLNVTGIDLSDVAIQRCKKELKGGHFICEDIVNVILDDTFDIITLFDVLEHIIIEEHQVIFDRINRWLDKNGKIFISIPDPTYLDGVRDKMKLQPIDQSLYYDSYLSKLFNKNNLVVKATKVDDVYIYYVLERDSSGK